MEYLNQALLQMVYQVYFTENLQVVSRHTPFFEEVKKCVSSISEFTVSLQSK